MFFPNDVVIMYYAQVVQ